MASLFLSSKTNAAINGILINDYQYGLKSIFPINHTERFAIVGTVCIFIVKWDASSKSLSIVLYKFLPLSPGVIILASCQDNYAVIYTIRR